MTERSDPFADHRLEQLEPARIREAIARRPIAYLPHGAIEFHGEHLPVGLDCFTAHELCLRAAKATGGVVFPPQIFGMWASLGHQPWTFHAEDEAAWRAPLALTLRRLEAQGVKLAVLFTGHFALQQLDAMKKLREDWQSRSQVMRVLTLSISELPDTPFPPDHGGLFETTALAGLRPDLVHLERLSDRKTRPADDPGNNVSGPQRRDPHNVLYGIMGADPRALDLDQARALAERLTVWLIARVDAALD